MNEKTFVLLDSRSNLVARDWSAGPWCASLGERNWACHFFTLGGGLSQNLAVLDVVTPEVQVRLLPGRGLGIWQAFLEGVRLGWDSPAPGPVHPAFVEAAERGGLGWIKGFDEWLVRCGLEWNGAPGPDRLVDNQGREQEMFLPLHGNVANLPVQFLAVTITAEPRPLIVVRGELDEARLFGPGFRLESELTIRADEPAFTVSDRITNTRSVDAEFQILYHVNFGPPLVGAGAVFDAPWSLVAPRDHEAAGGIRRFDRFGAPKRGRVEQCFYLELAGRGRRKETSVLLTGPKRDRAVELSFSTRDLPCFSLWKNTGSRADGYVVGLEPATNYPNRRAVEREQGRVRVLESGASWSGTLNFRLHRGRRDVSRIRSTVRAAAPRGTVSGQPVPRLSG